MENRQQRDDLHCQSKGCFPSEVAALIHRVHHLLPGCAVVALMLALATP
jgi:hypothetical protein